MVRPNGGVGAGSGPWTCWLAAWCGVAAGCLEVATRVLAKNLVGTNRLYMMSRHFVWVVPIMNLLVFCAVGLGLALATKLAPRLGRWLSPRLLCAVTILPALIVAGPEIYAWAWSIVAWGIAVCLVPQLERSAIRPRRWLILSLPVLLVCRRACGGFRLRDRVVQAVARERSSLA